MKSSHILFPRLTVEAWLIAAIAIAHAYAALAPAGSLMNWFRSDDAFYYYVTAQHIAEGHGITFDGLGHTGGFHPLWMAICAPLFALARLDLMLPLRLVIVIAGLLNAGTAILVYRLARRALSQPAAAVAGAFFALYPPIHTTVFQMGLESGLSAFSLALLLYQVAKLELPGSYEKAPPAGEKSRASARGRRQAGAEKKASAPVPETTRGLWIVGACATLAVLARLDNIFVVLALGAWLVLRPQLGWAPHARILALADIVLVPFAVVLAFFWRVGFGPAAAGYSASQYTLLVLALVVRILTAWLAGLYTVDLARRPRSWLVRGLAAWGIATALLAGLMLALLALGVLPAFPRLVLPYEAGLALLFLALTRSAAWVLVRPPAQAPLSAKAAVSAPALLFSFLRRAIPVFGPTATALVIYMAFYKAYFGTFSPVSGQVKRWWGSLPNPVYGRPVDSLAGLLGFFSEGGPWSLAGGFLAGPFAVLENEAGRALSLVWTVLFLAALLWLIYKQGKKIAGALACLPLLPLAAGSMMQVVSYTGTGYLHMRVWYWTTQMLLITLVLAALFDALLTSLPGRAARLLPLAAALALAVALGANLFDNLPYPAGRMTGDVQAVRDYYGITELEQRTEPGARIGSTGGGVIAYLLRDRTIVNMDGLMNTAEYFHSLQTGHAAQYLDGMGLDYVFSGEYVVTSSDPYFQLADRLEKLDEFGGAAFFRWRTP